MGCAKSKVDPTPAERPVLDADEEERKQRLESAVLARREAVSPLAAQRRPSADPSAPALETLGLSRNHASAAAKQALRDARPGLQIFG